MGVSDERSQDLYFSSNALWKYDSMQETPLFKCIVHDEATSVETSVTDKRPVEIEDPKGAYMEGVRLVVDLIRPSRYNLRVKKVKAIDVKLVFVHVGQLELGVQAFFLVLTHATLMDKFLLADIVYNN